jgi:hypothetical protein
VTGTTYHPMNPIRVLDTRRGLGLSGTLGDHHARTFQVTGVDVGGIKVPGDATAVTGNLTVTQPTALGYLYLGPAPADFPGSSTLNFPASDDRANAVSVALGPGGTLSITYASPAEGATTHVVLDVTGYYGPETGGSNYVPLAPTRILDTRIGTGGLSGPFTSHTPRTFEVSGVGGVPEDATAVTGNLTVTEQTALGYLYLGPVPMSNPSSSTLNFPVADDRANAVSVALGPGGTLSVTYASPADGATTHVVLDVTGYYGPEALASVYVPVVPTRILDTRDGTGGLWGSFASRSPRTFQVTGRGGIPAGATAVTGNLTATQQTGIGYLYMGPGGTPLPGSSTLNFHVYDDRANAVSVELGAGGTLSVTYASPVEYATAQVVFDVTGYYIPAGAPFFTQMSIFRAGAWSQQATSTWCVGASTQMMLNLVTGASDHGAGSQHEYMDYAYYHSMYWAALGAEVDGWANTLTHYGAGAYSVLAYPTFAAAIKIAAIRMRITGKPVGLVVLDGHHAWVMTGFSSLGADPAVSTNFVLTSIQVMAAAYGLTTYDPAPGSVWAPDHVATKLTPYTDDFPTIWDGQYLIVAP